MLKRIRRLFSKGPPAGEEIKMEPRREERFVVDVRRAASPIARAETTGYRQTIVGDTVTVDTVREIRMSREEAEEEWQKMIAEKARRAA